MEYHYLITKAKAYYDEGELKESLNYFLEAEKLNSNNDLLIEIALIFDELKDYESAKKYYYKVLDNDINNSVAYYGLATIFDNLEEYDEAIAFYKEAIKFDTNYYQAHFFLANIYDIKEEINLAIFHYQKVLEINPRYFYAYLNLGAIYENLKNDKEALKLFNMAKEIDDSNHLLYFNLGVVYRKLKQIELSIGCYYKSLSLSKKHPPTFLNLAIIYKDELKDLNKAIDVYTMGISLHPCEAVLFYNRACAYFLVNDIEKAIADLAKAISIDKSLFAFMQVDKELAPLRKTTLYHQTFINN